MRNTDNLLCTRARDDGDGRTFVQNVREWLVGRMPRTQMSLCPRLFVGFKSIGQPTTLPRLRSRLFASGQPTAQRSEREGAQPQGSREGAERGVDACCHSRELRPRHGGLPIQSDPRCTPAAPTCQPATSSPLHIRVAPLRFGVLEPLQYLTTSGSGKLLAPACVLCSTARQYEFSGVPCEHAWERAERSTDPHEPTKIQSYSGPHGYHSKRGRLFLRF